MTKPPSFSVVVPTWEEYGSLSRTVSSICYQHGERHDVELILVSDGPDPNCRKFAGAVGDICTALAQAGVESGTEKPLRLSFNPGTRVIYDELPEHRGSGDYGRAHGITLATGDWLLFMDNGSSYGYHALASLEQAIEERPDALAIVWDVAIMGMPAHQVVQGWWAFDTLEGVRPEVCMYPPGIGICVRRELAQRIGWSRVHASDRQFWAALVGLIKEQGGGRLIAVPDVLSFAYSTRWRAIGQPFSGAVGDMMAAAWYTPGDLTTIARMVDYLKDEADGRSELESPAAQR